MKRTSLAVFLLILAARIGFAQTATPEFELQLHYSDVGHGGNSDKVAFGYDPSATVGIDPQFGEMLYPGSPFAEGYFLAFALNDSTSGDYTEIDILPKPVADSFVLQYPLYLSGYKYPATLSWDRSKIPSAIKGIWITPYYEWFFKMGDMVSQNDMVITSSASDTNYYHNWQPAQLTIYYNRTPELLGVVQEAPVTGLLSPLSTYPNPMRADGKLLFSVSQDANVTISAFDMLGHELFHLDRSVPAGNVLTDLCALANTHGAVLLRVDAESGSTHQSKSVMVVKE